MARLTDREAVRRALCIAIDTEESLIAAYDPPDYASAAHKAASRKANAATLAPARANIAAFTRVLNRYYGGRPADPLAKPGRKVVSIVQLLTGRIDGTEPHNET